MRAVNIKAWLRSAAPTRTMSSGTQELLDIGGGFDCGIIISQETDVDFEFVDVDAFDQLCHSMNESKVMVTIIFVSLIMLVSVISRGFQKVLYIVRWK